MATSKNDPRILAAINTAMNWERAQVGKATARSVWAIAYPQWTDSGYAWCGGFQVAAYKQAGVDLMKCAWWFSHRISSTSPRRSELGRLQEISMATTYCLTGHWTA